ncbi:MAG: DUF4349 domain-containing protein, partial [Erysipelotrichaceae bacterium]|nr:DUF4349 domain-containing protein [Erysipelotrichaceae bacterium]
MKYKKAMDHLEMTDEMKEEILQGIAFKKKKSMKIPWMKTAVLCGCVLLGITLLFPLLNSLSGGMQSDTAYLEPSPAPYETGNEIMMDSAAGSEAVIQSKSAGEQNASVSLPVSDQAKRVYRASLSLQTQDYSQTVQTIQSLAEQSKGFISSENASSRPNELKSGYYEVRIPTDSLNSFLEQISSKETVISSSKSMENSTQNYYDAKSVTESLMKEKERLMELMAKAENVSDLIAIESQLSSVEQQIQSAQQNLSAMDLDLEYST